MERNMVVIYRYVGEYDYTDAQIICVCTEDYADEFIREGEKHGVYYKFDIVPFYDGKE